MATTAHTRASPPSTTPAMARPFDELVASVVGAAALMVTAGAAVVTAADAGGVAPTVVPGVAPAGASAVSSSTGAGCSGALPSGPGTSIQATSWLLSYS